VQRAHREGHRGATAMYKHIMRAGWWWPNIMTDIRNEISDCRPCAQYTVTKSGFHPTRSVEASRPGDHFYGRSHVSSEGERWQDSVSGHH
jgi:hypothetical protein